MEKIVLNTPSGRSEILIGSKWDSLQKLLPGKGVVIITDDNVKKLYGLKFPGFPVLSLKPGEDSKKLEVVEKLSVKLLESGIDRNGFILGIGGGVVCDVTGFLASIYMRGIRCGYVSTSLLSQVDASTGGKTGVNLGSTKNIIGTIRQPEFVLCDQEMLTTLSNAEYLSGLAEVIKTAIIGDRELFKLIEDKHEDIALRCPVILAEIVSRCVRFKASVVSKDENETGRRRILNFGHTFGHAIEMHESMKHGFAVAAGMELATHYSFEQGLLNDHEKESIISMLSAFNLLAGYNIPEEKIRQLILHDKKKSGDSINFVFAEGLGNALVKSLTVEEIMNFYKRFINHKKQDKK